MKLKSVGTPRHLGTSGPIYTFCALGICDPERFKDVSKVSQLVSNKERTRNLLMAVLTEIGMKV